MRINNNITALNSHRNYTINGGRLGGNIERLSSGFRINRAADDAAGLAISESMRTQIRGLRMASRNAQDGISLVQTAEGALQSSHNILQRIRELTIQAASDVNEDGATNERGMIQTEINQLLSEIGDISVETEFNGQAILDGTLTAFEIQVGANEGQIIEINLVNLSAIHATLAGAIGNNIGMTGSTVSAISALVSNIDVAIDAVSLARATLGAQQNRLEFKIQNLDNTAENLQAAESRIRDTDMAAAMTEFTRNNIMFQASTAMLAQANAMPQSVLQLLG